MFGISVNDVPGWLVAMAPSGMGVPVAFTPGLVPHCDVLTAVLFGAADAVPLPDELLDPLLLHPAAAIAAVTPASATTARTPGLCFRVPT
jgi:hypothetical protein